jgi:hypothetical protein
MSEESGCNFEQTVVKSLKSGFVGEEISEHIKTCANCRETAKVMQFFQTNLPRESPPKNLPVAGLIWWKFRLREKQRRAERIGQPIFIAQIIAVVIAFVTILWLRQNYPEQFSSLATALSRVFDSMGTIAFPFIIGLTCLGFVCSILVFALRRLMPDK